MGMVQRKGGQPPPLIRTRPHSKRLRGKPARDIIPRATNYAACDGDFRARRLILAHLRPAGRGAEVAERVAFQIEIDSGDDRWQSHNPR